MSWLPRSSILGDLRLLETFVFYDGPRLFSCESLTDQRYLSAWAEEGESRDLWLYVPISQHRLDLVRAGSIPVRQAFTSPESILYVVSLPHSVDDNDTVAPVEPGDLIDDWLPGEDFRLELDVATLPHITPSQIERLALQENRTRLRIEIDPPNMRATEYSSRAVGELLLLTQNVYDNIGLALHDDNPPQSGRIPFNVAEQTASNLVGASAASFVLELASSTYDDLFGEALFTRSTKSLMDLLDAELDRSQLSEKLAALRPRAAKSFRRFVTGLANTNGGATVAAAGAHMSYFSRELSPERLRTLVSILTNLVPDDDVREIRGRMTLYLGDTQRRIFGLRDEGTGDTYEGKVDDRAFSAVHSATLDDPYDVVLFEVSVLDEVVGETTVTYSLVQLSSVDPD